MNQPLLKLLPPVKAHLPFIGLSSLLRIVNIFLGVFLFGFSGYLLARGVQSQVLPVASDWMLLIGAGILKAAARYGEQVSGHTAAFRILDSLRQSLFRSYAGRDLAQLQDGRTGDLVVRAMGDVELIEIFYAHTLAPALTAVLFIAAAGSVTGILLGPTAGLLLLLAYAAAGIGIPLCFQIGSAPVGRNYRSSMGKLAADLNESLAGIQDLAAFAALGHTAELHRKTAGQAYRQNQILSLLSGGRDIVVDILLSGSLLALLWYGAGMSPELNPEYLWALVCGLAGGFGALLSLNRAVDDLPKSSAAADRILEVLDPDADSLIREYRTAVSQSLQDWSTRTPVLSLKNVSYRYPEGGGVEAVNLEVQPGSHLFIAGKSGAGKTSLASLMLGLIKPQQGDVLLDAERIDQVEPGLRYRILSAARQNSMLIRGTVQENIEMGTPETGKALPDHALEIPDIPGLYSQLADGPLTRTGGAEEQISGGQRRRILLAAALARDPRILVLDEAFAGMDDELRRSIRHRVLCWARERGCSIVEFSHDLNDGRDADSIAVMHEGSIVESGTWHELMEQGGLFADMAQLWAE